MINLKEINPNVLNKKRKYSLNKTLKILGMSGLMLLSACSKPPVVEPPIPEPIDYTTIETLDPITLFGVTPKQLNIDGKIVDYATVKDEVEYPFLYEVLSKEEIEYRFEELYKRSKKMFAIMDKDREKLESMDGYGNVYSDEQVNQGVLEDLLKKMNDISLGTSRMIATDPALSHLSHLFAIVNNNYILDPNLDEAKEDLLAKEAYIRLVYTNYQLYRELLEQEGLEYNPVLSRENLVFTLHL